MRNNPSLFTSVIGIYIISLLLSCNNPVNTNSSDTVTDIDGNVYHTVKIGNQIWTTENLRTTEYNDGTAILHLTDSAAWIANTSGAYCYYDNTTNSDSINKFGALYNWYAVNTGKLAPNGWHVPDTTDWNTLRNYLITNGYNYDGSTDSNKTAKSLAAKTDWDTNVIHSGTIGYDLSQNNRSGFLAIPGGCRSNSGSFHSVGILEYWWSTSEYNSSFVSSRYLYSADVSFVSDYSPKGAGCSVRLVKDN